MFLGLDYVLIGRRIADRRNQLKLTQAELAEQVNLTDKFISHIENATSTPSLDTIASISYALNIKTDYILFGVDNNNPDELIMEIHRHLITANSQELSDILQYIQNSKTSHK